VKWPVVVRSNSEKHLRNCTAVETVSRFYHFAVLPNVVLFFVKRKDSVTVVP
jgi:hypothetical protein